MSSRSLKELHPRDEIVLLRIPLSERKEESRLELLKKALSFVNKTSLISAINKKASLGRHFLIFVCVCFVKLLTPHRKHAKNALSCLYVCMWILW